MSTDKRLCLSLFSGIGGGALGFKAQGFETVGIDYLPEVCRDYTTLTGSPCHQFDLTTATPEDLRRATGGRAPDVIITSPPCQAFSGCLPLSTSKTDRYQALSSLAERGLWLVMEAWPDSPPRLICLENVPRIQSRGRAWLDKVKTMLNFYGYGWRETVHDCGEIGGLAQRRRRFLGVARHHASCSELLYEPPIKPLLGVGDVLGPLPSPATSEGGPMHRLPRLSALNWLRLACIPAGKDWRALPERVRMVGGEVDTRSTCERRAGSMGVTGWDDQTHAVISASSIHNTGLQVADPRLTCSNRAGAYGVTGADDPANTIIAESNAYHGQSWADPRLTCAPRSGAYGMAGWNGTSATIVASACHDNGAYSVADPRLPHRAARQNGGYGVNDWSEPSHTVIATSNVSVSWASVQDPRWPQPTHALRMADDGVIELVGPVIDTTSRKPTSLVIRALDGTWHRPMTTLELAALQGFPTQIGGDWLKLDGNAHKGWRTRIGNAIPPPAAHAIALEMARTLDASDEGVFVMSAQRAWVSQVQEVAR